MVLGRPLCPMAQTTAGEEFTRAYIICGLHARVTKVDICVPGRTGQAGAKLRSRWIERRGLGVCCVQAALPAMGKG